ncbi:MAG: hypothetical protein ACLQF1_06780 [Methyloceanibacter sp.]
MPSALAQGADSVGEDVETLQPGQFLWHPERSPKGPVAIIVSIPKQLVFVYRNDILIGVSTCSTGKPGHQWRTRHDPRPHVGVAAVLLAPVPSLPGASGDIGERLGISRRHRAGGGQAA